MSFFLLFFQFFFFVVVDWLAVVLYFTSDGSI